MPPLATASLVLASCAFIDHLDREAGGFDLVEHQEEQGGEDQEGNPM